MLQRGSSAAASLACSLTGATSAAGIAPAAWHCTDRLATTRQCSSALPSVKTEQDRKNFEILKYLAQRPVDTAFRIGALAGLGVTMRDLSLVLNSIYQKDVRGVDHPEIAAEEVKNTIKCLQALEMGKHEELQRQLKLHLARIIPQLDSLGSPGGVAAARRKVALCSKHDQEVINRLFPKLLAGPAAASTSEAPRAAAGRGGRWADEAAAPGEAGSEAAAAVADAGTGGSGDAAATSEQDGLEEWSVAASSSAYGDGAAPGAGAFAELDSSGALAREARIMHASGRFSRVRFPVWDVSKLDDGPAAGQTLRPRHMNKLPWMALLPPHLEVSYQTMTAIPLFPMQEAVYPEFVDVDYAMYYLSRYTRRYKRSRSKVRASRR